MEQQKTKSFRELVVWQKARDLGVLVYKLTSKFPQSEIYGLTSQMRRAAISVSSNIAESYHRRSMKEKTQFLSIAYGSCSELASQIEISKHIFPDNPYENCERLLDEVSRMLNTMVRRPS